MKNEKPYFKLDAAGIEKLNAMSPEQRAERLFSDKWTRDNATAYKRAYPQQYDEAKAAVRIAPNMYESAKAHLDSLQPLVKRYDAEVQRVREQISEDEARQAFSNQGHGSPYNLKQLDKTDPQRAYDLRLAMYSYGLLTHRPSKPVVEQPKEETPFLINDADCDRYHLPRGSHATATEYLNIVADYVQKEQSRKEAELAAENQVENQAK